ncbi:MAG: hypothetical protein HY898_09695 [Deltaproteobacteria bacterium]|nr:hypothetical protein [Deltaproteobacteria bacterium]
MKRPLLLVACLVLGCSSDSPPVYEPGEVRDGPPISSLQPGTLVAGSLIVVTGSSFVPPDSGSSWLRLRGSFAGLAADVTLPAKFSDYNRMEIHWPGGTKAGLPTDDGSLAGEAYIEVDSVIDGQKHVSPPFSVSLTIASSLPPNLALLSVGSIGFVNEPITVQGNGFLLGGAEGTTGAFVEGCFQLEGSSSCNPVGPVEIPCKPAQPFDRTTAVFPFHPMIAGIHPGTFKGTVKLRNDAGGQPGDTYSDALPLTLSLQPPAVFSLSPSSASLGQYVMIQGGGFVDDSEQGSLTTLDFEGTFTPDGAASIPASLTLLPHFVSGQLARYVLNTEDQLGEAINLREASGKFEGTVTPTIHFGAEKEAGKPVAMKLGIDRVKQVVWLKFMPSYVESLRHFGLRAADQRIRDRVFEVARRDYEGINIEFRPQIPEDFALFESVEISGPDPNGLGLLGYDNTPGKDQNNLRLYDKIGGVNATTQEDGYPGYGGVFVESFFGFSMFPGKFAKKIDGADAVFDQMFDPFRPDRGGVPVDAMDMSTAAPPLTSTALCPAPDRPTQIACAIWALGSMIGTTMTHEVGHSLGLADPFGPDFHNPGDMPDRLMDSGGARSLRERLEMGEGPAMFCDDDYAYLRKVLPTTLADPGVSRPACW